MLWAGSRDGVIKDNRITKGPGTLISPDGQDILLENNLIANHHFPTGSNQCIDATANGTSGSFSPLRFTFRQNTVWDCGNGAPEHEPGHRLATARTSSTATCSPRSECGSSSVSPPRTCTT